MRLRTALTLALLLGLSGCYRTAAEHQAPQVFTFNCESSYAFTVQFEGDTAILTLPDRTLRLPQVLSGSGARYSDGNVTFWNKGDTARLELGDRVYESCRTTP
jgi:putative lipoprotein